MKKIIMMFLCLLPLTFGCVSFDQNANPNRIRYYDVLDPYQQYNKEAKMAVVAGNDSPVTLEMANHIADGMNVKSTFKVMSRERGSKKEKELNPQFVANLTLNEDDVLKYAAAVNKDLKADYVYVIVSGNLHVVYVNMILDHVSIPVYGYMIEYPSQTIVGKTKVEWKAKVSLGGNPDDAVKPAVNEIACSIYSKIISIIGNEKK